MTTRTADAKTASNRKTAVERSARVTNFVGLVFFSVGSGRGRGRDSIRHFSFLLRFMTVHLKCALQKFN